MSKLSFKLFCIEKYADWRGIPSNEAYALFEKADMIQTLDNNYKPSQDYVREYMKKCFERHFDLKPGEKKTHGTIWALTLTTLIPLIMEQYGCGENEAMKMFYESRVGRCYADDGTGLYGQSAYYVADLFFEERNVSS